jgi:hypothetical protein
MSPRIFAISDSFTIKGRGTVLCMRPDASGATPSVGAVVEVHRPDGSVFRSTVKAVEAFKISPPPPPGTHAQVGVMLADDPGTVPSGSELHLAA